MIRSGVLAWGIAKYPSATDDWPRMMSRTWRTEMRWLRQSAVNRFLTYVNAAVERLKQFAEPSS